MSSPDRPDKDLPAADCQHLDQLLQHGREGDKQAAMELYFHFENHFRKVIRRVLPRKLRHLYDSDDFLHEAVLAIATHRLPEQVFQDFETFIKYHARLTANEVNKASRKYLRGEKQNLDRTVFMDILDLDQIVVMVDGPLNDWEYEEAWQGVLQSLQEPYRFTLDQIRNGWSQGRIARALGVGRRQVSRLVRLALLALHSQWPEQEETDLTES